MSALQLISGIYNVGISQQQHGLDCNPYLLVDGDEAVLFDPGSKFDYERVIENINEIIPLEKIKYVVLHHEDPDFCAAVPLMEERGLNAQIVTTWRSMTLIQYYDIKSPYYLVDENDLVLKLSSGRTLQFILTPYLHFAGSFTTYDPMTKTLFSSDLFGAFSYNPTLYADDDYMEKMLTFHEHYMPSNSVLRPVMEIFSHLSIDRILPQHGSMIVDKIKIYINALKELECGTLLTPIKKVLLENGGYLNLFNEVYKRYKVLFSSDEVYKTFLSLGYFKFETPDEIFEYQGGPDEIWLKMFQEIVNQNSYEWVMVIEPYVRNLAYQYDVQIPLIFSSLLQTITDDNKKLVIEKEHLENTIHLVNERLIKCPITGLYNETFFRTLLLEELEHEDWRDIGAYVAMDLDNFTEYKSIHSKEESNDALRAIIYIVGEYFGKSVLFKMDQTDFGLYIRGFEKFELIKKLDQMRIAISQSDAFLTPLTVSMGVVFNNELRLDAPAYESVVTEYIEKAYDRMRTSTRSGKNLLTFEGAISDMVSSSNKILIVDSDVTNIDIIKVFIKELNVTVLSCTDGITALNIAKEELPDLIVTEINLPRLDGYLMREQLLENSQTKNIPMIFLSYQKDEPSVTRAQALGISHYFKKPYLLYELIGIIKFYIKS